MDVCYVYKAVHYYGIPGQQNWTTGSRREASMNKVTKQLTQVIVMLLVLLAVALSKFLEGVINQMLNRDM